MGRHSLGTLVLVLIIGGIIGGILGEVLYAVPGLREFMPLLAKPHEIFNLAEMNFNLYVIEIKLGLHFAPSVLSLAGMFLAGLIYQRIR